MVICKPVTPILECPDCPATWDFSGIGVRGLDYTIPMHVRVAFRAPAKLCSASQKKAKLTFFDVEKLSHGEPLA
jgi:hypothetical protein